MGILIDIDRAADRRSPSQFTQNMQVPLMPVLEQLLSNCQFNIVLLGRWHVTKVT